MNTSLISSDKYQPTADPAADKQQKVPESLRRQARWAAYLFFATWLSLSLWVFLVSGHKLINLLALLPSLIIAGYLRERLSRHLVKNHRCGEEDKILPTLGAGNWITLLRATAVIALATLLPLTVHHDVLQSKLMGWLGGALYLIISLADLLDGYAARKQQQVTELGTKLDMETDAAGLLAASLVGIFLDRLPEIYLLVGLAYYFFRFGEWWRNRHGLPVANLYQRPYGRIIAGCQMGLVAMALIPVFASAYTHIAAVIFMVPFLLGFLRDWLVVSHRLPTDDNQLSRLDVVWGSGAKRVVALLARLLIAFSGVLLITTYNAVEIGIVWLTVYFVCCFLITVGCTARCSALLLLVLLAYKQSPFGADATVLLVFCGAATLVVIGSGPLSLWAPEDDVLYRRRGKASQKNPGAI